MILVTCGSLIATVSAIHSVHNLTWLWQLYSSWWLAIWFLCCLWLQHIHFRSLLCCVLAWHEKHKTPFLLSNTVDSFSQCFSFKQLSPINVYMWIGLCFSSSYHNPEMYICFTNSSLLICSCDDPHLPFWFNILGEAYIGSLTVVSVWSRNLLLQMIQCSILNHVTSATV